MVKRMLGRKRKMMRLRRGTGRKKYRRGGSSIMKGKYQNNGVPLTYKSMQNMPKVFNAVHDVSGMIHLRLFDSNCSAIRYDCFTFQTNSLNSALPIWTRTQATFQGINDVRQQTFTQYNTRTLVAGLNGVQEVQRNPDYLNGRDLIPRHQDLSNIYKYWTVTGFKIDFEFIAPQINQPLQFFVHHSESPRFEYSAINNGQFNGVLIPNPQLHTGNNGAWMDLKKYNQLLSDPRLQITSVKPHSAGAASLTKMSTYRSVAFVSGESKTEVNQKNEFQESWVIKEAGTNNLQGQVPQRPTWCTIGFINPSLIEIQDANIQNLTPYGDTHVSSYGQIPRAYTAWNANPIDGPNWMHRPNAFDVNQKTEQLNHQAESTNNGWNMYKYPEFINEVIRVKMRIRYYVQYNTRINQ